MGRREDINHHHTIRHTYMKPPRRKISTMLMIMLIISVAMGVGSLNSSTTKSANSSPSSPTREQLFATASVVAGGQWGAELMDDCLLLSKSFAAEGDIDAANYTARLVEGSAPDEASDKWIAAIAVDHEQAKIYSLALELSHQNRLSLQKKQ